MEYTYAALLLHESGAELNQANLTAVLEAGGSPAEESRVKALVAALEDVDLDSLPRTDAAETIADRMAGEPTGAGTPDSDVGDGSGRTESPDSGG